MSRLLIQPFGRAAWDPRTLLAGPAGPCYGSLQDCTCFQLSQAGRAAAQHRGEPRGPGGCQGWSTEGTEACTLAGSAREGGRAGEIRRRQRGAARQAHGPRRLPGASFSVCPSSHGRAGGPQPAGAGAAAPGSGAPGGAPGRWPGSPARGHLPLAHRGQGQEGADGHRLRGRRAAQHKASGALLGLNNGPPQAAPQAVLTCRPLRALQAAQGAGELPPGEPRACQDPPRSREQTVKWWRGVLLSPGSPLAASRSLGLNLGRAPSARQQAAGHPRPPRSPPPACFSPTAPCSIDPSCCRCFPGPTAAEDASDRQEGGGGEGGHHRDPQGSHPAAQVRHMVHGMRGACTARCCRAGNAPLRCYCRLTTNQVADSQQINQLVAASTKCSE